MAKNTPRAHVWHALQQIIVQKQSLDGCVNELHASELSDQDKAFARQLLMLCLRHCGQFNHVLKPYVAKPLKGKLRPVQLVLVMGCAQLLLMRVPNHAAIDTSVELCKQGGFKHQAGLVNVVLRKVAAQPDVLEGIALSTNIPSWLMQSWERAYGKEVAKQIAEASLSPAGLHLTVASQPELWAKQLGGEVIWHHSIACPYAEVSTLDGYDQGKWWVQDVASTLPVHLLGEVKGKQVLDLCAAPGGKTLQLATQGAQVTALDRSKKRLKKLEENVARTQCEVNIVCADLIEWRPEVPVDAVLLDAPCSATGTIRRHPDLLYQKQASDVKEMVTLQRALLAQVMQWLPEKVPLVYSTCSLQPEEGEKQVAWLLEQHPELTLVAADKGTMPSEWITSDGAIRTMPHYNAQHGGMDGFFAVKLVKN